MIEPDAIEPIIPVKLGAQVPADHLINNDDGEEDDGAPTDTVCLVLLDRGTGWIDVYPTGSKSTERTAEAEASQHFAVAKDRVTSFYCDHAPEWKAAARQCAWRISTATTGQPQTDGVAERSVRTVKEGGACGYGAVQLPTNVLEPRRGTLLFLQDPCHDRW